MNEDTQEEKNVWDSQDGWGDGWSALEDDGNERDVFKYYEGAYSFPDNPAHVQHPLPPLDSEGKPHPKFSGFIVYGRDENEATTIEVYVYNTAGDLVLLPN